MLKISILLPNLAAGGAERVQIELAREFQARGCAVEFVLMTATGDLLEKAVQEFSIVDLQVSRTRYLLSRLTRYLRRTRPDALLVALRPVTWIAIAAVQFSRTPTRVVVSEHNDFRMNISLKRVERKFLYYLGAMIYRRGDGIVAVSEGVADSLVETIRLKRSDISVIYNPVRQLIPEELSCEDKKILNRWLNAERKLITIGRLGIQKGFDVLVEAMRRLQMQRRDFSLLILGEGKLRADLEKQIRALGLQDVIFMPGFRQNPAPYLQQADLFVLSSDWEGLPSVVIEALSMGVPVVSTDCPSGPAEILDYGRLGTLVPVRDADALACAIHKALEQPRGGDALLARAKEFSVDQAAEQYLGLLKADGEC